MEFLGKEQVRLTCFLWGAVAMTLAATGQIYVAHKPDFPFVVR